MLRVIIADDENLICQMIVKMVDWAGLDMNVCGIAHDGLTVLRLIQTERPDIVITDIRMPGIDGLDMIQKAEEINKHVRFLIISGYRSFDYAHMAINLGVSHYLLKPIDHVELEDTLKQLYYEITKEQDEKNAIEELRYKSQNNKTQLRRHFLNDIIHKKNIHDNSHEFDNDLAQRGTGVTTVTVVLTAKCCARRVQLSRWYHMRKLRLSELTMDQSFFVWY